MATTPSVVPTARRYSCPEVSVAAVGWMPRVHHQNSPMVAITVRLFRIGANIGTANRRWVFSNPVATAPTP